MSDAYRSHKIHETHTKTAARTVYRAITAHYCSVSRMFIKHNRFYSAKRAAGGILAKTYPLNGVFSNLYSFLNLPVFNLVIYYVSVEVFLNTFSLTQVFELLDLKGAIFVVLKRTLFFLLLLLTSPYISFGDSFSYYLNIIYTGVRRSYMRIIDSLARYAR